MTSADAARYLGLRSSTFQNYMSRSAGTFTIKRNNPTTGAEDIATVTRIRREPAPPKDQA